MRGERIVLSCKVSGVQDLIAVYRELAARCDYPLHLGLTEAGMGTKGIVASSAALGVLLQEGIGDTIRVSLTPEPGGERARRRCIVAPGDAADAGPARLRAERDAPAPAAGAPPAPTSRNSPEQIETYLRAQMPVWRQRYPGRRGA